MDYLLIHHQIDILNLTLMKLLDVHYHNHIYHYNLLMLYNHY